MTLKARVVVLYHNLFNIKFATVSALLNGSIVAWINRDYGFDEYGYAPLWQALLSFFSTGVTARVIQHFSAIESAMTSYIGGPLSAALLTFAGSYSVHLLNGTPEVWASCLSPTIISYTTGFGTNFITRRGYMLPPNYPKG